MWETRVPIRFFTKMFLFAVNLGYLILYARCLGNVELAYLHTMLREQLILMFGMLTCLNTAVSLCFSVRCLKNEPMLMPPAFFALIICACSTIIISMWLHLGVYWHDPIQKPLCFVLICLHLPYLGPFCAALFGKATVKCT